MNLNELRDWIERTESRTDRITPTPVAALSATLHREDPAPREGDALPPLWHWLYFLPIHRQSELGEDGHPRRGGFLPPVPLPRRMFAGGRLQFHRPLRVGVAVTRVSRIADITCKEGRTGSLVFVKVRHEISDSTGVLLTEEQDLVYREESGRGGSAPPPRRAAGSPRWMREIEPSEVMLFRYSALTFNGHRIHYDRPYATAVEGYPALVVHGPLIATLLLDLLRRSLPEACVTTFTFRAVKPLFNSAPFSVCGSPDEDGKTIRLWAHDSDGGLTMEATATLA